MQLFALRIRTNHLFIAGLMVFLSSLTLSACVNKNYSLNKDAIGPQADLINPPKLITDSGDAKQLAWDRAGAFGPVPSDQQKSGQKICEKLGKDVIALGYNPKALDSNGVAIKGGGFLCANK